MASRDYGDLRVTSTSSYSASWNDQESGAAKDVAFYLPIAQEQLGPLGSVGVGNYQDINGKQTTLLVGVNPDAATGSLSAVARPTSFTQLWTDKGSRSKADGSIWRPVAPSGYVSVGDVVVTGYSPPNTDSIWCLRSDLVKSAPYEASDFWNDNKSGARTDCSCWRITPETIAESNLPTVGTFRASSNYNQPDATAYIPNLK